MPPRLPPLHRWLDRLQIAVGVLGAISALWWAASVVFGIGLVTFATGSMSPSYPAGSLAVSVPEPLHDVRVGDVVTVDRGAALPPITHRVVAAVPSVDGRALTLRLKGDANGVPDPVEYVVPAVRRIVLPLPPVADVLRFTGSPVALVIIAALMTGSAAWALWPSRAPRATATASGDRSFADGPVRS